MALQKLAQDKMLFIVTVFGMLSRVVTLVFTVVDIIHIS